jgi:hypothetical protein
LTGWSGWSWRASIAAVARALTGLTRDTRLSLRNALVSVLGPDVVLERFELVDVVGELIVDFTDLDCQFWHRIEADRQCEHR